ncbi:hypothetical protein [Kitasatospora sp. NPDC004272]
MPDRTSAAARKLERAKQALYDAMAADVRDGVSANEVARRASPTLSRPVVLGVLRARAIYDAAEAALADTLAREWVQIVLVDRAVALSLDPRTAGLSVRNQDVIARMTLKSLELAGLSLRCWDRNDEDDDVAYHFRNGRHVEITR